MKEDSFVSHDKGTGERSDDEYSLDGSDEYSVNTVEESEDSGDSEREEDEGSEESEESGSEESGSEESGSEESGSEESGSEESEEEDEEKKGTLFSNNHVLDMLGKPYERNKDTIGAGKNKKPKQHFGERYPGTRGSRGDSTTLISSGAFQYPDSYHSPDPASVSNDRSLESLAAPKEFDKPCRPSTSIQTATSKLATENSTKQPNEKPNSPSKLHFDGWMPHRYARVSTTKTYPLKPKAYLISSRKFSEIEKELTGDKERTLDSGDAKCLHGLELQKFHVQNIAVGPDGSVSVLGWLDNERKKLTWTRTVLARAWGRERADQLLSFYLKQASARGLPNNKKRMIQQGGNCSELELIWDEQFKALEAEVNKEEKQASKHN